MALCESGKVSAIAPIGSTYKYDLRLILAEVQIIEIAILPLVDPESSMLDDTKKWKESPLELDVPVAGFTYEVGKGKIVKIGSSK